MQQYSKKLTVLVDICSDIGLQSHIFLAARFEKFPPNISTKRSVNLALLGEDIRSFNAAIVCNVSPFCARLVLRFICADSEANVNLPFQLFY